MEQDLSIARNLFSKIDGKSAAALLTDPAFELHRHNSVQVCYSPFDHIEKSARLVIVGITPGMTQAVNALNALHSAKLAGVPFDVAIRRAKMTASFSGPLRANLITMLDHVGVHEALGYSSATSMFEPTSCAVHFTSALRYPVFVDGKNYAGNPSMLKVPVLKQMVETHLAEEARILPNAIWLPLGSKAEEAVMHLAHRGVLPKEKILANMPHPSGANAERVAVFVGRKRPELASRQTNAQALLRASENLKAQVRNLRLPGDAA